MIRLVDFLEVMAYAKHNKYYYWGNEHTLDDLRACYSTETYFNIIVTFVDNEYGGITKVYLEDKE